jgi:hypothetical protein
VATDLWPAGLGEGMVTPVSILREQAALLGPKTNQLVKAEVVTRIEGPTIIHLFQIVVPTMDNYKYELLKVWHDVILYPVTLAWEGMGYSLADESQFRDKLASALGSDRTRKLINALLAQVAT